MDEENLTMDMLHRVLKWVDHNRATAVTAILAVAACVWMVGCGPMIEAFVVPPDDTGLQRVPLHDDDDGIPDAMGYANDDGTKVIDPDTGKPAEVPGSREKMSQAGSIDVSIAQICATIGIGIPAVGAIGRAIGRLQPTKRFAGVVNSIQAVREEMKKTGGGMTLTQMDKILSQTNADVAGLTEAITLAKAAEKAERIAIAEAIPSPAA